MIGRRMTVFAAAQASVSGIAAGTLTWEVSATYPFTDAANAYEAILEGHVRGKSVLTF